MSSIRITEFPNGLRLITDSMESVETVSFGAWVGAGSRHESDDMHGVSHLLEHMVFKGTERRSARDIAEEIEAVGGHLNAYTAREHTAFYAKVLKDDLGLAVDVISDLVQHATLDPEELDRERSVILQEIFQANDTPDDIVFDFFQEAAFPDQKIGRAVLGTADSVNGMHRDRVQSYMKEKYSAPRIVISAAGKVDHDDLVARVGPAFAGLTGHVERAIEPAIYRGGEHREHRDLEQVQLVLGFSGVSYTDDNFYAASMLSTLFGGGMSSRLFQEAREKRGLCYSIYSFMSCYADSGLFGIYAGTGDDMSEDLIQIVRDEIAKVCMDIDAAEIDRARAQLKASILMSLESTSSRCEQAARQLMVYGRTQAVKEVIERIDAVDRASTIEAARQIFKGPITLATLGSIDHVPLAADIESALT